MTCQRVDRMPAVKVPHRLEPERTPRPGPLGVLDALVDAVERHNLDAGPDSPVPVRLVLLAEQLGAIVADSPRVERWHATAGSKLHDALMDAQERFMVGVGDE